MPDNVNVVYSNAQSNVFHLTFVNNKGLAEIPYEIKQQTIKLVGTRVVTTTTGHPYELFFRADWIGPNQSVSNTVSNAIPVFANVTTMDYSSPMSYMISLSSRIKRQFSYSFVDINGDLVDFTNVSFVQLVFEFERDTI